MEGVGPPFYLLFLTEEKEEKKFKLGDCKKWYATEGAKEERGKRKEKREKQMREVGPNDI